MVPSTGRWARFIYAVVIASISVFVALIWLIPSASTFYAWLIDVLISLAWFAVFGIFIDFIESDCNNRAFDFHEVGDDGFCGRWRTAEAFAFISAVLWLVSALVGMWFMRHQKNNAAAAGAPPVGETTTPATTARRPWYRRHQAV